MKTVIHTDSEYIEAVIRQCDVCFVGMADPDGTPYVLPMNFGYSAGVLYLHSAQEGRSIDILKRNPKVCVAFNPRNELVWQHPGMACSYRMRGSSVIAWGTVVFEEDMDRKKAALDILMKQYTTTETQFSDPAVANVKIWRITFDKVTCKEFGAPHK